MLCTFSPQDLNRFRRGSSKWLRHKQRPGITFNSVKFHRRFKNGPGQANNKPGEHQEGQRTAGGIRGDTQGSPYEVVQEPLTDADPDNS